MNGGAGANVRYLDATLSQPTSMMHPMQRFAAESDAVRYEELQAWNVLGSAFGVEHELFYVEADREPYEAKLDSVDSVAWYDLTPVDDGAFYLFICQETREEDVAWRQAFAAMDLLIVPPVVYHASGEFSMTVVGESETLQAMIGDLPPEMEITVNAIGEYDRRHATVAGGLTDRQLEALSVAVDCGYYETPRAATIADVASELDCADSTASAILQRAEASVMARLVTRHGRADGVVEHADD